MNIQKHLDMLGRRVEDRITGVTGIATSVCFDLYGCIQVAINRGMDKDGKYLDSGWYDINRFKVQDGEPVMERPDFVEGPVARGEKGPAEKPLMKKM